MKAFRLYTEKIGTLSGKRWVIVLLPLLILLFNTVIFPSIIFKGNLHPYDVQLYYSAGNFAEYITGMSSEQKFFSIVFHTTADILYPVLYTVMLSILLFLTSGKYKRTLTLLPLSVFFLDLIENIGTVILVVISPPQTPIPEVFFVLAATVTTFKWLFAGITVLVLCIAFLLHLYRRYGKNTDRA